MPDGTNLTSTNWFSKERVLSYVRSIVLIALALIVAMPIFWMISASFKFEADIFSFPIEWIPSNPTFHNYEAVWTEYPFAQWYLNTFKVTFGIVLLSLTVSSMAGYAFAKLDFPGKNVLLFLYISTMMIPFELRIIPQLTVYQLIGIQDTHWTVILPWMFNPFHIFLFRQAIMQIPSEITESAKIDGCPQRRVFWQLMIPNVVPTIMALLIIQFVWSWNSYLAPLIFISTTAKQLIGPGITMFVEEYSQNYGLQMAGASSALLPILIVYLLAQRYFIEGVAMTGIKG